MDPRAVARDDANSIKDGGTFTNKERLAFLPKFDDGETRNLRLLPPRQVLEWLLENPNGSFDEYCDKEVGPSKAWREIIMHYNVGPDSAVLPCLKMNNEACPIDEAYEEDVQSENSKVKKGAVQIKPKNQYVFFVEWRDHPSDNGLPYAWVMSPVWAKKILALIANTDYTVLYDPVVGHDIRVTRTGDDFNNTDYEMAHRPQETFLYEAVFEDNKGEFVDLDFERVKKVLENLPDIASYNDPVLTYEEYELILNGEQTVKEVYKEHFATENSEDEEDDSTEFDKEKLEKEEEKEKESRPRRRVSESPQKRRSRR